MSSAAGVRARVDDGLMAAGTWVSDALCWACHTELEAFKPGNVHVYAGGHGMSVAQFRRSAEVASPALSTPAAGIGARVLEAVRRTREAVGCNTNLGIALLAAPLAAAAQAPGGGGLRARVRRALAYTGLEDARAVFEAIRLARPGGLGHAPEQDVEQPPSVDLLTAMRLAAGRDRIARQYVQGFEDVFETGCPSVEAALARYGSWRWAAVACHLRLLGRFPDSHIARKHGPETAERVRAEAAVLESLFEACENPASSVPALARFDNKLKRAGINPGTHADLTVASLFALALQTDEAGIAWGKCESGQGPARARGGRSRR